MRPFSFTRAIDSYLCSLHSHRYYAVVFTRCCVSSLGIVGWRERFADCPREVVARDIRLPGIASVFLQDPELFLEHNNYEPIDLLILFAAIGC